jgi:hypothetical protein
VNLVTIVAWAGVGKSGTESMRSSIMSNSGSGIRLMGMFRR